MCIIVIILEGGEKDNITEYISKEIGKYFKKFYEIIVENKLDFLYEIKFSRYLLQFNIVL